MKSDYISFLKNLLIFSGILGIITAGITFLLPSRFITPALPFLFALFIAITLISYYILFKATKKKFIKFINYYLLTTIIKLFLFIAILVVYILMNKTDAFAFGISFFILYLCYTFFEVVYMVSFSKTLQQ